MCRNGPWGLGRGEPSFISMNHFVYADIIRLDFWTERIIGTRRVDRSCPTLALFTCKSFMSKKTPCSGR